MNYPRKQNVDYTMFKCSTTKKTETLNSLRRACSLYGENFGMLIEFECSIHLFQEYKLPYNYQIIQYI